MLKGSENIRINNATNKHVATHKVLLSKRLWVDGCEDLKAHLQTFDHK